MQTIKYPLIPMSYCKLYFRCNHIIILMVLFVDKHLVIFFLIVYRTEGSLFLATPDNSNQAINKCSHPELHGIREVKAASKTNWMFLQTAHIPHWPFYCDSDRDTANVRSSPISALLAINTGTATVVKLGLCYNSSVQETNISD